MIDVQSITSTAQAGSIDAELVKQSLSLGDCLAAWSAAAAPIEDDLGNQLKRLAVIQNAKAGASPETVLAKAAAHTRCKSLASTLIASRRSTEFKQLREQLDALTLARIALLDRWVELGLREGSNVDWPRATAARLRHHHANSLERAAACTAAMDRYEAHSRATA